MKKLFFLLFLIPIFFFSQKKEVLRYFISEDSLVGVKNQKGEIIIPAEFRIYSSTSLKNGEKIKENIIYIEGRKINEADEKNASGYMYDRKGNFLYQPFIYDNGADYFVEGVRRFVKNGKVGFADQNGKIVIEAKHDFVSSFNYGYAAFCNGCDWEKIDDEHSRMAGGIWGVMNYKGEIAQPVSNPSEKDVEVDGKYYPYVFQYNQKEKEILQFFEKYEPLLFDLHALPFVDVFLEKEKKLFFEIIERPKENFPYYRINTYNWEKRNLDNELGFLVSEDRKKIYKMNYDEEKEPFNKWLKEDIRIMLKYQEEHPDHPNKLEIK
ncbi:WG repeat-containing protein [Chryseobacterium sp.]|uniref:WG repeat-containing protein n=1 Tax=Chryseobacterium sp. TaxID=1871047 RepID=UPI0025BA8829|nr:WG repeat-containing protein [Chryseobacterium sp.]